MHHPGGAAEEAAEAEGAGTTEEVTEENDAVEALAVAKDAAEATAEGATTAQEMAPTAVREVTVPKLSGMKVAKETETTNADATRTAAVETVDKAEEGHKILPGKAVLLLETEP